MNSRAALSICLMLSLAGGTATAGGLTCHVTNAGMDVRGASVTLCPGGATRRTDADGLAEFTSVPAGGYIVTAEIGVGGELLGAVTNRVDVGEEAEVNLDVELSEAVRIPEYFPMAKGLTWCYSLRHTGAGGVVSTDTRRERVLGTEMIGSETACLVDVSFAGGDHYRQYEKTDSCGWRMLGETLGDVVRAYRPPVRIPRILARGQPFTSEAVAHSDDGSPDAVMTTRVEFVGFETISVPAGRFNCIRLHLRVEEGPYAVELTTWMAPGIGAVRSYEYSDGERVRRSLIGYTRPGQAPKPQWQQRGFWTRLPMGTAGG